MELEGPTCLTPGSSTKPQSSREYGTEKKKNKLKKHRKKKKTVRYWYKDRNIDQWKKKIKSLEINPLTYRHLTLTKEARIYNGLKTVSLTNGAGKTGQSLVKE